MKFLTSGMLLAAASSLLFALPANAQDSSIYVQCPDETDLHPGADGIPGGDGIKCEHLVAGDGMTTMADGYPQYIFGFARVPLPALTDAESLATGVPTAASGEYPGWVMQEGMLAANAPAPTIEVDEDDELFLSLTNVGMTMRPDLFDPHTVHWHGFPQASSVFDGVPDSSIAINMGATLTYYYLAKDAGTYMYHCHVEATEHMQMGMLGNLFVRPRQNNCSTLADNPDVPGTICPTGHTAGDKYAYNDGDRSTRYDEEYPIQLGSFDPDFHDASLGVQPLPFAGMNDRYFLLNGRGYPDTANPAVMSTDGRESQPVSSLIEAAPNQRILLRISNLNITRFYTIGTNGIEMQVIGLDARLLRDDDGNNMYYTTNSLTLGGGQSADVIIDTAGIPAGSTFFLYSQELDRLANNNENFGGMMTEIHIN